MSLGFETCHSRSQSIPGAVQLLLAECREPSSLGEGFSQEMGGWYRAQSLTGEVFSGRDQRLGCFFTIPRAWGVSSPPTRSRSALRADASTGLGKDLQLL